MQSDSESRGIEATSKVRPFLFFEFQFFLVIFLSKCNNPKKGLVRFWKNVAEHENERERFTFAWLAKKLGLADDL